MDVQCRSLGAGLDEGSGKSENLTSRSGNVKGLRDGELAKGDADEGLVAGLDSDNGASGGEDGRILDERSSSEVTDKLLACGFCNIRRGVSYAATPTASKIFAV